jgi:predicted nucleotidyltransferase
MKSDVHDEIIQRLDGIERDEGVRILFACESGSRAWGFASADSDYDVRFIYVHPRDWYLSIEDRSDVIERPIDGVHDFSGWDLRKALRLFRKSNPPLLEWLGSPFVYRERGETARALRTLMAQRYSPRACAYHHLHMARGNVREYLKGDEVLTKKYLYVLRPLLAIQWIERQFGVVPTEFGTLVERLVPGGALRSAIDDLIERKRLGSEISRGPKIAPIGDFIEAELERHESNLALPIGSPPTAEELDAIFREALESAPATPPSR